MKKKNIELFNSAYSEYLTGLKKRAFYKIQNQETSEDLVQSTFMKTWIYLVKGGKIDLMRAFLYHILNGLIIDEYRKRKTFSLDTLISNGYELSASDFERGFDIHDGTNAIVLMNELPIKYHEIMKMRYLEDLSLAEIALITGQTKNTIAVQSHRGLEKLKKLYNDRASKTHV